MYVCFMIVSNLFFLLHGLTEKQPLADVSTVEPRYKEVGYNKTLL